MPAPGNVTTRDNSIGGLIAQIGIETVLGDGNGVTGANKRLRNTKFPLKTQWLNTTEYKAEGGTYGTETVPGDEVANGDGSAPLSFTESNYVYDSAIKTATPASGGAGAYYTRVWVPPIPGTDVFRSYAVQRGNGRYNRQWNGVFYTGFDLNLGRDANTLGGPLSAQNVQVIDAMTATPTKIASVIAQTTRTGLFMGTDWANLAASPARLSRNFSLAMAVHNIRGPIFPMNETLDSYAGVTERSDVDATVDLKLGIDVLTPTTVPVRANTTAYLLGDVVKKASGPHTVLFRVTTAGTTGASEPAAFGTATVASIGSTITDASVTWTVIGFDVMSGGMPYAEIRQGATYYFLAKTIGPVLHTDGTRYLHQVKFAAQANAFPDEDDQDQLATHTHHLRIVEDPTTGNTYEVTTICKLATL